MSEFEQDDIMPNGGDYFGVPRQLDEEIVARKKEKAKTLQGLTVLKEMVKRFEDRILFYKSTDAIPDSVKTNPVEFMHLVAGNSLAADNLIMEKEYIEGLLDEHAKGL